MDRMESAYELMSSGRTNCAQAVLSTYSELFGLDRNLALSLAQGFGSGLGRSGNTCGAVTGAYMVLGLAHRIPASNPKENLEKTYGLIQVFNRQFVGLHHSIVCRELIGCDVSTQSGIAEARKKLVFSTICPNLVRDSVKILEELLNIPV